MSGASPARAAGARAAAARATGALPSPAGALSSPAGALPSVAGALPSPAGAADFGSSPPSVDSGFAGSGDLGSLLMGATILRQAPCAYQRRRLLLLR